MNEPKSFASLSSGLLARKGAARPAMRPQGFGQFGAGIEDLGWNDMGHASPPAPRVQAVERDHSPSPITALTPMGGESAVEESLQPSPPVVEQQRAAIAASFAQDVAEERNVLSTKVRKPVQDEQCAEEAEEEAFDAPEEPEPVMSLPQTDAAAKAKAAFTLRLDSDRHLKLRLACAVSGRSAQQLVTEALDQLIQSRPDVSALAQQVPAKGKRG